MANVKITELTAYTNPASTDVVPIVDLVNDQTKKVTLADIFQNFPDGTESAPSIAFDGVDAGIYSPGGNQVAISTSGVQRINIEADGDINIDSGGVFYDATNNRLGIGTSTPDGKLTVGGTASDGVPALDLSPYSANIVTTSDIVLSANGCISASDSIRNITTGTGFFDWYNNATADNTGTVGATPLMRLDGQGRLGVGDTGPDSTLTIKAATGITPFKVSGPSSEFARIDSSGRLLVGTSSARSVIGITPPLQIEGISANTSSTSIIRNSDNAFGPSIVFGKSRGSSTGLSTIVDDDDTLGSIFFIGADGSNLSESSASISAEVDGTPIADAVPGRLVFSTTESGSSSPTERMRISNNGAVNISTNDLTVYGLTVGRGAGAISTNTAVGNGALVANTTGTLNTAIGSNAFSGNTTGGANTAIGRDALSDNTTGSQNTAIGRNALGNNTTGSGNFGAAFFGLSGLYAPVFDPTTENNRVVMGHTSVTNAYVQVAWTVVSDARDKMNFGSVPHSLEFVKQLNPVSFQFKIDRDTETPNGPVRYGFKAQDILALEGEDNAVIIDNEDPEKLRYNGEALVPVLVNAIKELAAENAALKARLDAAGI